MIYGYARVSTDAQDLTNQLAQLKAAGCEKIFRDKLTGAHADRPQLQTLLRAGDAGRRGSRSPPLTACRATRPTCSLSPATSKRRALAFARSPNR